MTSVTAPLPTDALDARIPATHRPRLKGTGAHQRASAARARVAFVLKATQQLGQAPEPGGVVSSLLELIVPELADAAIVELTPPGARRAHTTLASGDALADWAPEAWSWVERVTRPSITRAVNLGMSDCGTTSPGGGRAATGGEPEVSYLVVPLRASGRNVGALCLLSVAPRPKFGPDERRLAEAVAHRANFAIRQAWVYQEQRALVAKLQEVRERLDSARAEWLRLEERRRIAQALHDDVEQAFFAIGLTAAAARDPRHELKVEELAEALRGIGELSAAGAEQLRAAIFSLKHAEYSNFGLVEVLRNETRSLHERSGIETDLVLSGTEAAIPADVADALHAVAREAMANIERHAHANSAVVTLQMRPRSVTLIIHDDGIGAPANLLRKRHGASALHFGLAGLSERVRRLHGSFSAHASPNGGFVVRARVPLATVAGT